MSSSLTYQCAFLTSLVEFERNTCTLLRSGILFLSFANSAECVSESALARPTSLTDCFSPSVWTAVYLSNWVRSEARTPGHTTLLTPPCTCSLQSIAVTKNSRFSLLWPSTWVTRHSIFSHACSQFTRQGKRELTISSSAVVRDG